MKTPEDKTVRSGTTARLDCAATGQPPPQISWQKDGGSDFPAARERRMYVEPTDDAFFIVRFSSTDQGVYSCTATNAAGTIMANVTLSVLGTFLLKHHLGPYTCLFTVLFTVLGTFLLKHHLGPYTCLLFTVLLSVF